MQDIVLEIRCAAWLLWRIHLAFRQMAFREGMGAHFALVLTKVLPAGPTPFCLSALNSKSMFCLSNINVVRVFVK